MGSNRNKKKKKSKINRKNLTIVLAALVVFLVAIVAGVKSFNKGDNVAKVNKTTELTQSQNNETYSASLIACGDVMAIHLNLMHNIIRAQNNILLKIIINT